MNSSSTLSKAELTAVALDHFVIQPVNAEMIKHLATAAGKTTAPDIPASIIEEFIAQLVRSSEVNTYTLMSSLVYLPRLELCVQSIGRHCVFPVSLNLAATYLNHCTSEAAREEFGAILTKLGLSMTEFNDKWCLCLSLLNWELDIPDVYLYDEFDSFLAPIRAEIQSMNDNGVFQVSKADAIYSSIVTIYGAADSLRPYTNGAQAQLLDEYRTIRNVDGVWGVLNPVIASLSSRSEAAVNAIICYTRGVERSIQCTICAAEGGVFPVFEKCIVLPGEFETSCANCIYAERDCIEEEL
ncbi:hypothetical protein C8A01DRAFT_21609 [Parachaetomium inaequale]|uniref:Uncharacterized protein n=1 Tax=Parachaetomium inaequale TaxID=2588326 RepID=A0AAN6P5G5_9PEZI|nr:hypothetical protein C8A01DRAFT_21609 [Parachaetomium inaequale]